MLLKMTCLWRPSAWLSARLWLARVKLSLSPSLLAPPSPSPWTPRRQHLCQRRRRSPVLQRNAARREKFLKRKVEPPSIMEAPNPIQCPLVISHTSVPFSVMEAMLESFKCDQCDDRFVSNQGLICHTEAAHKVNLHVAPHPLQCTHCGQSFLSEQDLKVHSTSAHASKLSSNLPFHSSPYQHLIPESWG